MISPQKLPFQNLAQQDTLVLWKYKRPASNENLTHEQELKKCSTNKHPDLSGTSPPAACIQIEREFGMVFLESKKTQQEISQVQFIGSIDLVLGGQSLPEESHQGMFQK